ncbi:transposase family protein [Escherichia coli 3-073-06_S1_C2]|jgi:transposase|nr:transposase family protein [Escherichia coli 3-073-06_S1_C2]
MSRKTQRYSKEFKAEAVRTVLENQLSISEGASRLSLPEGTLGQWVTATRKGLGTPGSRTVAELESEILQLRKALNEARLERDILKKATVDSIGQRNSYVKTWGCGGFLNETNIYSRGKSLCF